MPGGVAGERSAKLTAPMPIIEERWVTVPAAYVGVILIWATTPLGIKWSGDDIDFLFGVTARMAIGLVLCLLLVALMSRRMRWYPAALYTYLAAGIGMWLAMTGVYWAAQQIPSGLISVVFGLAPLVTGWMAATWLGEVVFTPFRIVGMACGVLGLGVIFAQGAAIGSAAFAGIAVVIASVVVHSLSAVWVKRIDAGIHPLEVTTGALIVAVPLYALTWWLAGDGAPVEIPPRALAAILYLGVFGSVIGFVMYYYLLTYSEASRVALITLVTPVLALMIGQQLNAEVIGTRVWIGTLVILLGLASFQWGDRFQEKGGIAGRRREGQ